LLVWDKDSYTGSSLVLFPCICEPQLVHLLLSSSLFPSPLPMVTRQFEISIFIPVQTAHQPHSSFYFAPLVLSRVQPPLSVTHVP
jgi:hypothetical protein